MHDSETIALRALTWLLSDEDLTNRFMGLSGIDADSLRGGLGENWLNAAVLTFLCHHEPDLTACSHALDMPPQQLVRAAKAINGSWEQDT